ncbi:beta-galactosidase-1-like protein [Galendromus occidentalis]|uniref:Beta-galactosidase-1-like protein n=1 Tax=Galendromus occidentalis TaxID=34638 RepID=A0AAJ7L6S9_9ACAR|nr:beta-galactosidase-1-like protein [Galendromus occidentalis]
MSFVHFLVIVLVYESVVCERTFSIDYQSNSFVKDGEPFQFVSGSLNYFNVPHELWEKRLHSMKLGGVNVLQTGIEWRSHESEPGKYSFRGQNDVVGFIRMAQRIGFLVNIKIGPFIDSNRDMGGMPWWLLSSKSMELRTANPSFLAPVDRWFSVLLPKLRPLLYRFGGPILLVQLENQYGSSGACDSNYTAHLLGTAQQFLGRETVFVTADVPTDEALNCGSLAGCLATASFGPAADPDSAIRTMRRHQSTGPLVNSGFSTADADVWGHAHHTSDGTAYAKRLDELLSRNMSVNIAMFHGGSNWYFDSGAKLDSGSFSPFTTSFDMDALLDEAGDPTPKFFDVKRVLKKRFPNVPDEDPATGPKMIHEPIKTPLVFDLDFIIRHMEIAGLYQTTPSLSSMESFGLDYGIVVYSTAVPSSASGSAVVRINDVRDRGYVYVDGKLQGRVDRSQDTAEFTLNFSNNSRLDIAVENQGRMSDSAGISDRKGMIGSVTMRDSELGPWKVFQIARTQADLELPGGARLSLGESRIRGATKGPRARPTEGFGIYAGFFVITESICDTYLKLNGFTKGYVWLNGNHLGRYWTTEGPQQTMYVPSVFFNASSVPQQITIIEQEHAGDDPSIEFVDKPMTKTFPWRGRSAPVARPVAPMPLPEE